MSGFLDRVSCYMDPFGNELERHPDLGIDERHVCGVLSHRVEDNFLVLDVVVLFVREWRKCAGVWLIVGVSVTGLRSSR